MPSSGAFCPYPTICRLWVACSLRVVRLPVVFLVAPLFGGRQSAALPDWSFCGKTATRCPQVVFLAASTRGHGGRPVETATPLREHRHPGPVRASVHLHRVLVRAGVTLAVHSNRPVPLAPVAAADRSCAHGRVNSHRAVDRPCSRLIRPQGPRLHTSAWRACPRRSRAVGCCWCLSPVVLDSKWYGRSASERIRARVTRPGSASRTRGHTSGRPANNVDVPLAAHFCTVAPFEAVGADPLPVQVLGVHGWCLTRDHHAGMGADHSVNRSSGRAGPLWHISSEGEKERGTRHEGHVRHTARSPP